MKTTMILGGHTAVICVRNARSWGITAQSRAALMKSHTEQHTMHVLQFYICHVKLVLYVVELRKLVLFIAAYYGHAPFHIS